MNRSFISSERVKLSTLKDKEEELALFLEMKRLEKERNSNLLPNSEEFDAPLESAGSSPSQISTPTRKNCAHDFLNSEDDKNDNEWLITPPGTPLSSVEKDSPRTYRSPDGSPKTRPTVLKSRLGNSQPVLTARSNLGPQLSQISSPSSNNKIYNDNNNSSMGFRRPSTTSSPGLRSITPSARPTLTKSISTPKRTPTPTLKPTHTPTLKPTPTPTLKPTLTTGTPSRPRLVRSSTPTPRSNTFSAKSTLPTRSSTPTPRSTIIKSSQPVRTSTPPVTSVRAPTQKPTSTVTPPTNSPKVRPLSWKQSEMPGYTFIAPPNMKTSLPGKPVSAARGRTGPAPTSIRSSSVDPGLGGRVRRQSASPARGRNPNLIGGSVPALSRLQSKAKDSMSPVMYGTKMVERMVNMRKLAPPKQDDSKRSPNNNLPGKSSSSPDNPGFGRTLSKKSLDMAIRHMDIRQRIPGNVRPSMTNIQASSMYSVKLGPTNSISESGHGTSSNSSSEMSVHNNNAIQIDDDDGINSHDNKDVRSPAVRTLPR